MPAAEAFYNVNINNTFYLYVILKTRRTRRLIINSVPYRRVSNSIIALDASRLRYNFTHRRKRQLGVMEKPRNWFRNGRYCAIPATSLIPLNCLRRTKVAIRDDGCPGDEPTAFRNNAEKPNLKQPDLRRLRT